MRLFRLKFSENLGQTNQTLGKIEKILATNLPMVNTLIH